DPVNSPFTRMTSGVALAASVSSCARLVTVTVGPPQPPVVAPFTVAQPSSPAGTPHEPVGVGVGVGVGGAVAVGVAVGVTVWLGVGVGLVVPTSTSSISPDANLVASPIWPAANCASVADSEGPPLTEPVSAEPATVRLSVENVPVETVNGVDA